MRVPITSLQNGRIKYVVKLRNRRRRDADQVTVVEGIREIQQALARNLIPTEAYICPQITGNAVETAVLIAQLEALSQVHDVRLFAVTPEIFAKIAYRGESGGLLLVLPYWHQPLNQLLLSLAPFFIVVENAEKPGNLGAILRTADAAGVDGVIVCTHQENSGTDLFNPNVIRASMGAIFSLPIAVTSTNQAKAWLRQHHIQILAATPDGDELYTAVNMVAPTAIITGSESHGLTPLWLQEADYRVVIPMFGRVDSLNLSVSTALLMYEVVRQRGHINKKQLPKQSGQSMPHFLNKDEP